jgi:type I restriction enzyme S subunit
MKTMKLGEACESINGLWTGKKGPFETARVIRNTNFTKDCRLDLSNVAILEVEAKQLSTRRLRKGDLVIEKSGGGPKQPVGRVVLFEEEGDDFSLSNFTSALRIKSSSSYVPKYLYYFILLQYLSGVTEKMQSNTTGIRNLNFKQYLDMDVPTPSLSEQKAIVEKLDATFAEIDKLEANLISRKAQIQFLQIGIIDQLISESDPNSRDLSFGDLGQFVRGPFGGSLKKSIFVQRGYAVFEQQHAINNQFDSFRYFITEEKFEEMIRFAVQPGDLIMSCSGTFGKIAIVPQGAPPGVINQALLKIKPHKIIHSDFLLYWMHSSIFQLQLAEGVGGAALQNVPSTAEMKKIRIILPSLETQSLIVDRLRAALSDVDELQRKNLYFVNTLKSLRQSILSSAFTEESNVA